jgi:hypothetical protein
MNLCRRINHRQSICFVISVFVAGLTLLIIPKYLYANGETIALVEKVGGYEITVKAPLSVPSIDSNYHISIMVLEANTYTLVQDMVSKLTILPPPNRTNVSPIGPVMFPKPNSGERFSHLGLTIPEVGSWAVLVDIEGPLGIAQTKYVVNVTEPGIPFGIISVVAASVFLLVALIWTIMSKGPRPNHESEKL